MFSRLILYLSILLIGGIIGSKKNISENTYKLIQKGQGIVLFLLLFIMGLKIGADNKILSSFFQIGYKALILSSFSVIFSVLLLRLFKNIIKIKSL